MHPAKPKRKYPMTFKSFALAAALLSLPLVASGSIMSGAALAGPLKGATLSKRIPETPRMFGRQRSVSPTMSRRTPAPGVRVRIF
jgi:hypothetical protein